MKQLFFVLALLLIQSTAPTYAQKHAAPSDNLEWYTDLMKAHELSQKSKKPIFAFFTGSDWCGWCHKLQRDVFAKPAFIKWAKKNVILLELDFPRQKQLSPELMQQNNNLQQAFKVQGYPTIWMFTMEKNKENEQMNINAYGSLGYPAGSEAGKEEVKFLNDADAIIAKSKEPKAK
jgi:thioredoxin-related protein